MRCLKELKRRSVFRVAGVYAVAGWLLAAAIVLETTLKLPDRLDSAIVAALFIAAYRATQYREPRRRRSTYDELISTGEIGLIREPALQDLAI
ncbi:MAG: hypothetical protein HXY21_05195 [Parvularculaceae bacterium]|nr:hypothetical protein [Parvularculaceae bacterium]